MIGSNLSPQSQAHCEVLEKIFWQIQEEGRIGIPFLLVVGQLYQNISPYLLAKSKEVLGQYWLQDFLHIQDFTDQLGKTHTIRLDNEGSKEILDTLKEKYNYTDISIRETLEWLARSPAGKRKIVLIDNMGRLTLHAANALLKVCEEPLPNRLIIGTIPSFSSILPTLASRACIVRLRSVYNLPSFVDEYIQQRDRCSGYVDRFFFLQNVDKNGHLQHFLDGLLMERQLPCVVQAKKYLQTNVHKDSVLLRVAINSFNGS